MELSDKTLDDNGRPTYHVVDGKQRLQTIIEFTQNKIRIPDDFANIDLQKKRWDDLNRTVREQFWNYVLSVEMFPDITDASVRNIFERINRNSRKLMHQELRHAKYDGWFIHTAEAEAEKQEWKDFGVVTPARMKRMADVQFISELMNLTIKMEIEGFDQDSLDDLYAKYEDLADQPTFVEDDFRQRFEKSKSYIRDLVTLDASLIEYMKVQSHFYTLWSYLSIEQARWLAPSGFLSRYKRFLLDVTTKLEHPSEDSLQEKSGYQSAVAEYATNIRGASTDQLPRQKRFDAFVSVLHGVEAAVDEGQ